MRKFELLLASLLLIAGPASQAAEPTSASARNYPGGADEQDLKVQPELKNPTAKLDRRTLDQKALQGFLRKTGGAKPAPASTPPKKR